MDKDKALEKIKKCLALSQSANEHEAAQALKQAQALMAKHGLTDIEVSMADVDERSGARRMANKLPGWQWGVAQLVARALGCQHYKRDKSMMFYGLGNRAEIAAYAFDVLFRQVNDARRRFLKTCRARNPKNRTYLADKFCDGWVRGAFDVVMDFAMPEKEQKIMEAYKNHRHGKIKLTNKRCVGGVSAVVWNAGADAAMQGLGEGRKAQLHQAMGGENDFERLGE